ncbi:response regulator [Desulfolutivibrio sulfoxidireducens]|uniref:response regulator n=1 Tax=Desulfolutivibrio sulfoxidireducens TaxID=2773299 RepID=UPI00159D60B5|nr:response regulator [Desulfolutivibrio sulfoxidireducens]QLA21447.1 response regulator [Desulfolutivibrio sulfoxidireducens]
MNPGRPHILILDDEERIRELLAHFLEDFDEFAVSVADSGEQALADLAGWPADVAVVDMRLPGMSGTEFIVAAARDGVCRRFVVHTGSNELVLTEELAGLGLSERDIFYKPAGADRILGRIRELLSQGGR